ncbi:MAG: C40 family peptidase [Chitinophagaceae bacterium]
MNYAIISVPAAPVRRKPGHREEMVNQLLFGELVKVIKTKGELWVKIQSLHDGYIGWMTNTMLQSIEEDKANTINGFATAELLNTILLGENKFHIPVGSSLPVFENGKGRLGETEYIFSGKYFKRGEQVPSTQLVTQLSTAWLNAPYLWGGRTPLGVDCSGFVQVIYKLMGIDLPRDAWQQAQVGKSVKIFSEVKPGDLAFFDNKEDIVHVGIILENNQLIHSSGKVRMDLLTKKGIINTETGKKTLRLRTVRRIWEV